MHRSYGLRWVLWATVLLAVVGTLVISGAATSGPDVVDALVLCACIAVVGWAWLSLVYRVPVVRAGQPVRHHWGWVFRRESRVQLPLGVMPLHARQNAVYADSTLGPLLLDTGAQHNVVSASSHPQLARLAVRPRLWRNERMEGFGDGPRSVCRGVIVDGVRIGGLDVGELYFSVVDVDVPGLAGLPLLLNRIVELDFPTQRLCVLDRLPEAPWVRRPPDLLIRHQKVVGLASASGKTVPVQIDTGASHSSVGPDLWDAIPNAQLHTEGLGIQGRIGARALARVPAFQVGGAEFEACVASVSPRVRGINLGMDLLGDRVLVLDGIAGRAWISPPRQGSWSPSRLLDHLEAHVAPVSPR